MDCSCNINTSAADIDGPAFESIKTPKARKPYRCHECRRDILPGELYERYTGLWDGRIDTYKTCTDCLSVRRQMFTNGFFFGMIWDDVHDHIDYTGTLPEDCLAKMTPRAREKCCNILESLWDNIDYDMEDDE